LAQWTNGDASFDKLRMKWFCMCHKDFLLILSLSKDAAKLVQRTAAKARKIVAL